MSGTVQSGSEAQLRKAGAGLFLIGAAAWGLQLLLSAIWISTAIAFILVVLGPQLIAAIWTLAPWRRRMVRYLPPILIGAWTFWWSAAVLLEGSTGPPIPQLVFASLGGLVVIEAVTSVVASVLLAWAWWVSRRASADASAPSA